MGYANKLRIVLTWTCFAFVGCGGSDGLDGANGINGIDGASSVLTVTDDAPVETCADGGVIVSFGLDANRNGELDSDEIEGSEPICQGGTGETGAAGADGAQGVSSLIEFEPVTDGCAEVTVGLDNGDAGGIAGDGVLDPGEIDSTTLFGDCERTVFVTADPVRANFGGEAGGAQVCNDAAEAAGLDGTYLPFITTSTFSPAADFSRDAVIYVRVDGVIVAEGLDDLDNSIQAPISLDQNGETRSGEVWTGSGCNDYTSQANDAPFPTVGRSNRSDNGWRNVFLQFCNRSNVRLYCFEQ